MRRNICVITGSRAEYGLASCVLRAIQNHPKLRLSLIVCGIHLANNAGQTIREIKKDGFRITSIISAYPKNGSNASMCEAFGLYVSRLARIIPKINPDILMVLTDLDYALSGAIVGSHLNIPVAHLHGGDLSGSIDESIRHAVTKLSHIHFAATDLSAQRILKMGEEPFRVKTVGSPVLDDIRTFKKEKHNDILFHLKIDPNKPFIVMIQHPVTTESKYARMQIKQTINAITKLKMQTIMFYPNLDAGSKCMIEEINKLRRYKFIRILKHISRNDYLRLLSAADVLVGNSSSGITESASFKLPVVNIGTRQSLRERAANVIDARYNQEDITRAIRKAVSKRFVRTSEHLESPYGDGKSAKRIAAICARIRLDQALIQKKMTY